MSPNELEKLIEKKLDLNNFKLILYNDEINTIDHVIESLMKCCDHTLYQANQCALIAHYNGKCTIKVGLVEELIDYKAALINQKLTVELHG